MGFSEVVDYYAYCCLHMSQDEGHTTYETWIHLNAYYELYNHLWIYSTHKHLWINMHTDFRMQLEVSSCIRGYIYITFNCTAQHLVSHNALRNLMLSHALITCIICHRWWCSTSILSFMLFHGHRGGWNPSGVNLFAGGMREWAAHVHAQEQAADAPWWVVCQCGYFLFSF